MSGYHSIIFDTYNTYDDFHMYPSTRPFIAPPALKTNYLELNGCDGSIDLSTALTGYPIYKNREGSWEFIVEFGYNWVDIYSDLMTKLNGKVMKVILEDDPNYYYRGRIILDQWNCKTDGTRSTITIKYNLEPYKYYKYTSVADPDYGTIFSNIDLSSKTIDLTPYVDRKPVCPFFKLSSGSNATFIFKNTELNINETFSLSGYCNKQIPEVILSKIYSDDTSGVNTLTINGTGTMDLVFTNGRL